MPQSRYFSDTAVDTTLVTGINDSQTSIVVVATTGFPASFPYTLCIDKGTENEELVDVTGASGTTLSVTRGYAGSGAIAHAAGASVKHVFTGSDATDANAHIGASQNVHGLAAGASVVGTSTTQTLSGKTISGATNTITNIQQSAVVGLEEALAALENATGIAFTPAGSIAATTVAGALAELDSEKQAVSAKDAANGYAGLSASSKLAFSQIPTGSTSSTVSVGNHTHTADELELTDAVSSLTAQSLTAGSPGPKTLGTLTIAADTGKYLILASCLGINSNSAGTAFRAQFYLDTTAGTLTTGSNVQVEHDRVTYSGAITCFAFYDSTGAAGTASIRFRGLQDSNAGNTSATGQMQAIRVA